MFQAITNFLRSVAALFYKRPGKPTTTTVDVKPPRRPIYIPASSFTKKGPGVKVSLWRVLRSMSAAERQYCRRRGWDKGMVRADGSLVPKP